MQILVMLISVITISYINIGPMSKPVLMFCLFYGMKKKYGNFAAEKKKKKKPASKIFIS